MRKKAGLCILYNPIHFQEVEISYKYWVKQAFFVNGFELNCDNYTTKRINMQEEFRIFFGTDLGAGSGWNVLDEMLYSLRCGCAKAPRLT